MSVAAAPIDEFYSSFAKLKTTASIDAVCSYATQLGATKMMCGPQSNVSVVNTVYERNGTLFIGRTGCRTLRNSIMFFRSRLGEMKAVSARGLGAVHGGIGAFQQGIHVFRIAGIQADADA